MNKLPANLKTEKNNTFGQTINANFDSLENLYQELKYAFGGLNFIQLYGEVPYKGSGASGTLSETGMFITGYELDYSAFKTTVPGTTYLALKNIHDLQKELGNSVGEAAQDGTRWLPIGTFIVSTNDGWRSYNPVYTTHIYQPSTLVCKGYNPNTSEYTMEYTYEQVPISSESILKSVTTTYIDTTQTEKIEIEKDDLGQEKIETILLKYAYPTSGVNVRLIDPSRESSLITYEKIENDYIQVKFFPVVDGEYIICIDYGLRPEWQTNTSIMTYDQLYVTNPAIDNDSAVLNKLEIETLISNSNFINDDKLLNYYTKAETNNKIQELTWTYATKTELSLKVDKEEGKQLSTNDFTDESKNKLDSLNNYDDSAIRNLIEQKANKIDLFSGDYNDLDNKPKIPSKTSELINDSNFITAENIDDVNLTGYAKESWVEAKGYATTDFVTDTLKNYQPTINLDNYYTKEESKKNFSQVYVTNEDGATWITVYNDNVTNRYSINAATFGWKVPSYYAAATDLNNKANSSDVYNKSEVDALISNVEVDLSDYYTKEETDGLVENAKTWVQDQNYLIQDDIKDLANKSDYYTKAETDQKFIINIYTDSSEQPKQGDSIIFTNGNDVLNSALINNATNAYKLDGQDASYYAKQSELIPLQDNVDVLTGQISNVMAVAGSLLAETDRLEAEKANKEDIYTKNEIDNKFSEVAVNYSTVAGYQSNFGWSGLGIYPNDYVGILYINTNLSKEEVEQILSFGNFKEGSYYYIKDSTWIPYLEIRKDQWIYNIRARKNGALVDIFTSTGWVASSLVSEVTINLQPDFSYDANLGALSSLFSRAPFVQTEVWVELCALKWDGSINSELPLKLRNYYTKADIDALFGDIGSVLDELIGKEE